MISLAEGKCAGAYKYELDAERGRLIVNAYMLAFFDTCLRKKSPLLEGPSPAFPRFALLFTNQ